MQRLSRCCFWLRRRSFVQHYVELHICFPSVTETQSTITVTCSEDFETLIKSVENKNWVVHNTKPTLDTSILENYLARYINRVAISKSKVEYLAQHKEVRILFNDYAKQKEGEPAPKAFKSLDPLSFIHQFMQHVLPAYFQKSRRYGLHASPTKRKYEGILPEAVKRNGHAVRTVMEILTQLIKDKPFVCEQCNSEAYEVINIQSKKEWIHQYISIPTQRPPPNTNEILNDNTTHH